MANIGKLWYSFIRKTPPKAAKHETIAKVSTRNDNGEREEVLGTRKLTRTTITCDSTTTIGELRSGYLVLVHS
jgi:hypothetical protein